MKTNKLVVLISMFATSIVALFFMGSPQAFAATVTWTGAGGDTNMNTVGNWSSGAPIAGDDLVFPANIVSTVVVNNYAPGTSFNSITFSGVASTNSDYTISGNALVVVAGITSTTTGDFVIDTISANLTLGGAQSITTTATTDLTLSGTLNVSTYALAVNGAGSVYIDGVLSGSGAITKSSTSYLILSGNNSSYTGAVAVTGGSLAVAHESALGTSAGVTTVSSGADLTFCLGNSNKTVVEPLTLSGTGINNGGALQTYPLCNAGALEASPFNSYTFNGGVTLGAATTYLGYQINAIVSGTYTANGHTFVPVAGSTRSLTLPSGVVLPAVLTTTYSANSPGTPLSIETNNIGIITGTYGDIDVSGGTLKGTGTVGVISMSSGTNAPGLSPGCLASSGLVLTGGTYEAELGGTTACSGYDQLSVTGTVALGTATTLTTSIFGSFKPVAGNTFTIIANDAADAVTGTFSGMAENATFTISGYVFRISYVGGTGNDVVLTVVSVPAVPNTGFTLSLANPYITLAATVVMTAVLGLGFRRLQTVRVKR